MKMASDFALFGILKGFWHQIDPLICLHHKTVEVYHIFWKEGMESETIPLHLHWIEVAFEDGDKQGYTFQQETEAIQAEVRRSAMDRSGILKRRGFTWYMHHHI